MLKNISFIYLLDGEVGYTFPFCIDRRNRIDLFTEAEKAIYDAQQAVERAGADVRLTEATILLSKAREAVADFVDGVESKLTPASVDGETPLTPFGEAIRLLRELADLQNGPPLETYRKDWEKCIDEVYKFLNKWEGSAPQELKRTTDPILNLLAVLHRDGGHYTAEHGLLKSCEDAQALLHKEWVLKESEPKQPSEGQTFSVDGEYWKKRCELAERYIKESPCDPDITGEQIVAWKEFQEYIREGSAPQEQPVIIPSNVLIQKGLSKGEEAPQETKQRIYINENWSKEEIIQAVTEYNDGIKEDVYINCPECNTRIVHKANVINLKESEPKQPSELRWVDNPESKVGGKMLVSVEQPSERQINYRDSMMVNGGNTDAEKIEWLLQQLEGRGSEGEGAKPDGRETGDN